MYNENKANVVPIKAGTKRPLGRWKKWQKDQQTVEHISSMDWNDATGLAVINGPGGWHSIDIDECEDEQFVLRLLDELGLSHEYPWVVKSPNGFHIWVQSEEDPDGVSIETHEATEACKQIEIRWSGGYTIIPHSLHPSGDRYRFLNDLPETVPEQVSFACVEQAVKHMTGSTSGAAEEEARYDFSGIDFTEEISPNPWNGDMETVERALRYLSKEIPSPPPYLLWLRIASAVVDGIGEKEGIELMKKCFPPKDPDGRDYERKQGQWLEEVKVGTLFYEAKQRGWEPTWNERSSDEPSTTGKPEHENSPNKSELKNTGFPTPMRAADVVTKPIEWFWPGYLVKGAMHVLDGPPGVNKTTVLLDIAAHFSNGKTPEGNRIPPQNTLYISGEDTEEHVLVPRFSAAGGNENRLFTYDTKDVGKISFPESLDDIEDVIRTLEITFCVIDPFFAMLDRGHSMNDEQAVRAVLTRLQKVAEETGCAFMLVRHPNKKEGLSAMNRGGGSIGIIAQARLAFMVGRHPRNEDRRVFAWVKNNLSPKSSYESLIFDVRSGEVDTGNGTASVPVIEWAGKEPITADDVYNKPKGRPPSKRRKAQSFLEKALRDGPVPKNHLVEQIEDLDFSKSTLENAADEMDIFKKQGTYDEERCSLWSLPSNIEIGADHLADIEK